jgi:hypothetical protein
VRVQWALLARYAEADEGIFTIIGGGFDTVRLPEFPAMAQFFLAANFKYGPEEVGSSPAISFAVRDSRMEFVGEPATMQIAGLGINPNSPPGWEASLAIAGPMQVELSEPGTYSVNIAIDDALKWDIPLRALAVDE